MKPPPTLDFFCAEGSAAFSRRRTDGASVANDFSMNTFTPIAASHNREVLTHDLVNLASRGQQYYRRPLAMG